MLWSVIPEAVVLSGMEDAISLIDGQVENCPCRLRSAGDGFFSIEALTSTDPKDFLNSGLQPGRRIFLPK